MQRGKGRGSTMNSGPVPTGGGTSSAVDDADLAMAALLLVIPLPTLDCWRPSFGGG